MISSSPADSLTLAAMLPDRQVLRHLHCVDQVRQVAVVDLTAQVAAEMHLHRGQHLHYLSPVYTCLNRSVNNDGNVSGHGSVFSHRKDNTYITCHQFTLV